MFDRSIGVRRSRLETDRPLIARKVDDFLIIGFHRDLAEVWQAHGRDSMLHTAKAQPATFFEAPNECAIYLLRSLLRQTSCWVSAITGGTGPKITGDFGIFGILEQAAPIL